MKTAAHSSLPPFLLLHVPDAFLINGRRMDGLTEGPDNNGWSTGHKCSYWGDLWASAHRRLSSNRWDDFSKALDGRQPVRGKALSLVSEHHLLIRCFGWKPLQEVHPGKSLLAVNMTKTGGESETVGANQWHGKRGRVGPNMQGPQWMKWYTGENRFSCNIQHALRKHIEKPWWSVIYFIWAIRKLFP